MGLTERWLKRPLCQSQELIFSFFYALRRSGVILLMYTSPLITVRDREVVFAGRESFLYLSLTRHLGVIDRSSTLLFHTFSILPLAICLLNVGELSAEKQPQLINNQMKQSLFHFIPLSFRLIQFTIRRVDRGIITKRQNEKQCIKAIKTYCRVKMKKNSMCYNWEYV